VILLQTALVPLCETSAELLFWVIDVLTQSQGGKFESTEKPEETGRSLLVLVGLEQGFEGVAIGRVVKEVGADFLLALALEVASMSRSEWEVTYGNVACQVVLDDRECRVAKQA
jgi:hypothetical protein